MECVPFSSEMMEALTAPFPMTDLAIKPAAVAQDGTQALALVYADMRAYQDRLDAVVGPTNWSTDILPWGDHKVIVRLTICGVTKCATGEGDPDDVNGNCGTSAEAQAFKRACSAFQLGRYLYELPKIWGKGEGNKHHFRFTDPRQVIHDMYSKAGLLEVRHGEPRPAPQPQHQSNGHQQPVPDRLTRARQVLVEAEQQSGMPTSISDAQRGGIINRLIRCTEWDISPHEIDRIGAANGMPQLSKMRRKVNLPAVTMTQASAIIAALQKLLENQVDTTFEAAFAGTANNGTNRGGT